jgi:hypothetical protein
MHLITIHHRDTTTTTARCPDLGGYVEIEDEGRWRQPCAGGSWRGDTLWAKPDSLRRVVAAWVAARRRAEAGT